MSEWHGRFVWYELMTTDAGRASAFYGEVVGWQARDSGMSGMTYTLFSAGGRDAGGMMTLGDDMLAAGARRGWIGYVAVEDVDASAGSFAEKGGRVHRAPADIPGVGRFAIVADPHGAVLALFEPGGNGDGPPPQGTIGHAGWRELMAGDLETAFAFYAEQFGWQKAEAVDMGAMGIYQTFAPRSGGPAIGGMMTKPASLPMPYWGYYFQVEAIDAALARVTKAGGTVVNGPHEVPGGSWIVQCLDPVGAFFALVAAQR
ncbi:VOC family protein [Aurantimonas sp. VKM B-3413]|uniref:VOC family protein n=1 Tax=Aurantimonas sp. VKM B-3413 TaxID=2779401 RepID=UPI001E4F9448|nr:VOC family protein [Aurantimonas sp. VKM B-3413]MCB8836504.1 VOC family protein [Aurantimonas sp. VKM B-3413]